MNIRVDLSRVPPLNRRTKRKLIERARRMSNADLEQAEALCQRYADAMQSRAAVYRNESERRARAYRLLGEDAE